MKYQVIECPHDMLPSDWLVEAIDWEGEGDCYRTIFNGPQAQQRAEEYAAWRNHI